VNAKPFFDLVERLFRPLVAPLNDRLNPILVKEVRQALRGRYFTVVFWLVATIATLIGCMILVTEGFSPSNQAGVYFFIAMYGCLSAAVHVFVPFWSFLSVGSEWEENTYDLLVLSNLRPFQIVLGKLLSAAVQLALFYSAFGPFLVFAFLLRGLDLVAAFWVLGLTVVTSLGLSALAICLSSLVRQKFARVLLMAVQAVILVWACAGSIAFSFVVFEERFVHTPEFTLAASMFATGVLTVGAYSFALASTRFTHPEENRSSGLRALTSVVVLAALGWTAYLYWEWGQYEIVMGISTFILIGNAATCAVFCAEEETLGRRVRLTVPASRLAALLAAPFLPGGGRGVLLMVLNALAVGAVAWGLARWKSPARFDDSLWIPTAFSVYLLIYVLIPTVVLSRWTAQLKWRVVARLSVVVVAALAFVIPTILGFLIGSDEVMRGHHVGNPVWVVDKAMDEDYRGLVTVALIAALAVLLNVARVGRGLRELASASAERRRREARAAGPAVTQAGEDPGAVAQG
jgi:hypothetical protein